MGIFRKYRTLPMIAAMLFMLACSNGIGSEGDSSAPVGGSTENMSMPPIETRVVREGIIEIPPHLGDMDRLEEGQVLRFRLFDDADYRARIRSVSRNVQGTVTVTASIEGTTGHMVAATTRGVSYITITIPEQDRQFLIHHDSDADSYRVREVVSREVPGSGVAPPVPTPTPEGN